MMKIVSKLIVALAFGAAATFFSGFDAPPARIIVFVGVTVIAFCYFYFFNSKKD